MLVCCLFCVGLCVVLCLAVPSMVKKLACSLCMCISSDVYMYVYYIYVDYIYNLYICIVSGRTLHGEELYPSLCVCIYIYLYTYMYIFACLYMSYIYTSMYVCVLSSYPPW